LKSECCDVDNPGSICKPSDELRFLIRCDNRNGSTPISCVYQYKSGLSYHTIDSATEAYESLGFNLENVGGALKENYYGNLGMSPITGYDWTGAPASTWNPELSSQGSLEVAPGWMSEVFQITGNCGLYAAKTDTFKEVLINNRKLPFSRRFSHTPSQ